VAHAAGVSTTTASDALNGRGRCSPETRERVAWHAEKLGYRANPSARSMRSQSTGIVAVMARIEREATWSAGDLEFLTRITQEISTVAWDLGYFPTLVPNAATIESLARLPLEGMVVIDPIGVDPVCGLLDDREIPYVCVSPDNELSERCSWVDNDAQATTRSLLEQLTVSNALMVATESRQRYLTDPVTAFQQWSAETGNDGRVLLLPSDCDAQRCYDDVLAACSQVDLLCIAAEIHAAPTLHAVRKAGLSVPGDLQIVAASDGLYARSAMPPLTCVDLMPEALGRAATEMLDSLIADPAAPPSSLIVDGQIRWRSSTVESSISSTMR
jgi:DNA-binding LacI/PurR family transcriptional regulator